MSSPRRKKSDDLNDAKGTAKSNLGKMRNMEGTAGQMDTTASSLLDKARERSAQAKKEYEESPITAMLSFFNAMKITGGNKVINSPASPTASSPSTSPKSPARESKQSSRSSTPDSFLPSQEDAAYIANVQTAITEYRRLNPNKAQTAKRTPELEKQLERLMRSAKHDGDGWDSEMKDLKELVRKFSSRETFGYGHMPHSSGIDTLLKKFTTPKPDLEPMEEFKQGSRRGR
jgi:hypothetical protein